MCAGSTSSGAVLYQGRSIDPLLARQPCFAGRCLDQLFFIFILFFIYFFYFIFLIFILVISIMFNVNFQTIVYVSYSGDHLVAFVLYVIPKYCLEKKPTTPKPFISLENETFLRVTTFWKNQYAPERARTCTEGTESVTSMSPSKVQENHVQSISRPSSYHYWRRYILVDCTCSQQTCLEV